MEQSGNTRSNNQGGTDMYQWDWQVVWQYKQALLYGLLMTVWLSLLAIVLGTALGGALAFAKRSHNPIMRILASSYIEGLRAIPILVLLLWIHYVIPSISGVTLSAFTSAVVALVLNLAAFAAENIRAGLETVSEEQYEAGRLEGASEWQIVRYVVLPQAIRNMLPNLMDQWITSIKLTSLASVIGVGELLNRGGSIIGDTFRPLEVYTALAVMYLAVIIPLVFLARAYEKRLTAKAGE
jgi:polar amino acid transport system permease protein